MRDDDIVGREGSFKAPSSGGLTATERRLAELVSKGASNKEAAAALFVTLKTVETKLSRIYAKLGIHSRGELIQSLGDSAEQIGMSNSRSATSDVDDREIVGRDEELRALSSFLEQSAVPGALLIQGVAGIGKTTLWRWGVDHAAEHGWMVLAAEPAAAEARLAFAGIGDLLGESVEAVLSRLPPPQKRALEVALLLEDAHGRPPDERTVAVGVVGALRELARESGVLVAIDDVQWLDDPSTQVLSFVARRLGDQPVAILVAERTQEPNGAPLGLEKAFGERLRRVRPRALSLGAIHRLLRSRLGLALPRPALRRVHAASGGNPLFALEIGRILLDRSGLPSVDEPLPVPRNVEQLVEQRIGRMSASAREAVLAAALQDEPRGALVEQAIDRSGLEEAVGEGVLVEDGEGLRFSHPLFAEAALSLTPARRRREMHLRLATLLSDQEMRAQHLALGTDEPSADVAAAIDAGAAAAAARGASSSAAELSEAAARLTPASAQSDGLRRRLAAADWHLLAGDTSAVRSLLEPLAATLPPGPERARVLLRLPDTVAEPSAAIPLLEQALADAEGDPELVAEAQVGLAALTLVTHGAAAALAEASRATELAELAGNRSLVLEARGLRLLYEAALGVPVDEDAADSLTSEYEPLRPGQYPPALAVGLWLMYRDRLDEARAVLEKLSIDAVARGDEMTAWAGALHLAELECRAGRYELAAERAEEASSVELLEQDQPLSAALYVAALADVYRGRVAEARHAAERGLRLARNVGDTIFDIQNEGVLGFLALSLGDARTAADRLAPLWPRLVTDGWVGEPSIFPVLPNAIHALLEVGEPEAAERLLTQLEERGRAVGSAWALSQGARLRGLVAAEEGQTEEALALIDEALALHERMPGPFEAGRTLIARGSILRRARRRREAREALEQALAIFEDIGAPLWAERTREEMARIGGRTPSSDLTVSECRLAELVAEGRSNKEAAAALFVTPKTVETKLSRIYAKLGIHSRAELTRHVTESKL